MWDDFTVFYGSKNSQLRLDDRCMPELPTRLLKKPRNNYRTVRDVILRLRSIHFMSGMRKGSKLSVQNKKYKVNGFGKLHALGNSYTYKKFNPAKANTVLINKDIITYGDYSKLDAFT